jgi:hypothetical protein
MSDPATAARRLSFRAPRVIFWTALGLRLIGILVGHTYRIRSQMDHFDFAWEAGRIARSLATGHGYANPFNGRSGPSAWLPPLYPLLIALSFKLFGVYTNAAALFLMVCDSVFSAAIAPAVYEIAARCFDAQGLARRRSLRVAPVALGAAWVWAAYPAFLQYAVHWVWEMSLSACLFTWALVLALRLRRVGEFGEPAAGLGQPPRALWLWSGFGLLWGLLTLSNPSLVLFLPATMVWIVWPQLRGQLRGQMRDQMRGQLRDQLRGQLRRGPRDQLRGTLAGAALACAVFAAVMSPWIIRNELVLHAFLPTRSNAGAELYESTLESNDALPWGTTLPLWPGAPEFQRYVRLGEVRYSKLQGQRAVARLRANPGRFARYTLDRFLFFWDGTPHPPEPHPVLEFFRQLNYCSLSACGLLGLALMLKRRVPGAGAFALAFVFVPLPYYLITVQPRFRHPLEPLIAILAVFLFRSAQTDRAFARRR